jgi:hypothetical protein
MAALGVPAEQVSVLSLKSAVKDGMATPQEEEVPQPGRRYLLFVLIQTEEGGFTEDQGKWASGRPGRSPSSPAYRPRTCPLWSSRMRIWK